MTEANALTYELPANISIQTIEFVASEFAKLVFEKKPLVVDAAKLEVLTTPGVQLFVSVANTLEKDSCTFVIINAGNNIINVFETLGFKDQYLKWSKANG